MSHAHILQMLILHIGILNRSSIMQAAYLDFRPTTCRVGYKIGILNLYCCYCLHLASLMPPVRWCSLQAL